jgi:hypothetical protein
VVSHFIDLLYISDFSDIVCHNLANFQNAVAFWCVTQCKMKQFADPHRVIPRDA